MSLRQLLFFLIQLYWWEYGRGLHDNQFDFTSFKDPSQWDDFDGPYSSLCTRYTYDIALEPRSELLPDSMRAPLVALTPVRIKTLDVEPAVSNLTLHIFNNPGIRKGYSVSYGFARNKECLHGQDHFCITSREFGRTRAVVLNAERFPENQNLNYIKDHFLIEDPERFVTIINEGSTYERKFYEAVFLGGYPTRKDASRSSHWIDGKTYPLEIYMYFVDETVPSMALTTVLVVLVEESDRDNTHVKPIVSTINHQLYNVYRQSVKREEVARRRAKLFHHLMESTLYDDRPMPGDNNETLIRQTTVSDSIRNEDVTTAFMEAYEKMEGMSSQLYFLDQDRTQTFERQDTLHKKIDSFNHYKGHTNYYPFDNNFTYVLFYAAVHKAAGITLPTDPFGNSTCEEGTDFIYKGKHALMSQRVLCPLRMCTQSGDKFTYQVDESNTKWKTERFLSIAVCKYLVEWTGLIELGYEDKIKNITNKEKYEQIQHFIKLRTRKGFLNTNIVHYIYYNPHTGFGGQGED
ncbi:unnamed protein product [Orchesella dallaii]|uniref:Uncharacterized protein n=1 Tax=Orchesella dallaii TaxID=48710 RepID=A0ABP1S5T9_9HEXA